MTAMISTLTDSETMAIISAAMQTQADDVANGVTKPRIGEKVTAREVQAILRDGGGTPADRALVAVGVIRARVLRAYKLGDLGNDDAS